VGVDTGAPWGQLAVNSLAALAEAVAAVATWVHGLSWAVILAAAALALTLLLFASVVRGRTEREQRRLARSRRRVRARLAEVDGVLVTNAEPGEWLNKLIIQYWHSYLHPKILTTTLKVLQAKLEENSDSGVIGLWVEKFHLGLAPPILSNWKSYAHRDGSGGLAGIEVDVHFATDQAHIELKGRGVVGLAQVIIQGLVVTGKLMVYPVANERLALFGFKGSPEVHLDYKIYVGASERAKLNIGSILPVRKTVETLFQDLLTEPNRRCVGLELNELKKDAVMGTTAVKVRGFSGVAPSSGGRVRVEVVCKAYSKAARGAFDGPSSAVDETFLVTHSDKSYTIDVGLLEKGRSERLGRARIDVSFLDDGSTAFWGTDPKGAPVAKRLAPFESWPCSLALMTQDYATGRLVQTEASVHLTVTQQGWRFAQPAPPEFVCYRSLGARTALMQVVEARDLPLAAQRVYVTLTYGATRVDTPVIDSSTHPVWNSWHAIEESPDPGLRRVQVHVRMASQGVGGDVDLGHVWFHLDAVHECQPLDTWLPLEGPGARGEIHLVAEMRVGRARDVVAPGYQNRSGKEVIEVCVREALGLVDPGQLLGRR